MLEKVAINITQAPRKLSLDSTVSTVSLSPPDSELYIEHKSRDIHVDVEEHERQLDLHDSTTLTPCNFAVFNKSNDTGIQCIFDFPFDKWPRKREKENFI